uniref:Uncharacterized protein n=1 Tax=Cyanothece sp. (strain PCC 7425 / ATCC 29141) TaxID=395961 RepID=B8HWG1_CYAP4
MDSVCEDGLNGELESIGLSLLWFILAGGLEIGGGYLLWLWLKEGQPGWMGLLGAGLLAVYGIVPTLQPGHFGRIYAAYGGVFILLSMLWGWQIDRVIPDRLDLLGAVVILVGVLLIMYAPRG